MSTLDTLADDFDTNNNSTLYFEPDFPLFYRVFATIVHLTIFLAGVVGNVILIAVIFRTKCLQTPTYRYLVSLAFADLLVLLSAVPEAIVFHHLGRRWIADQVTCSLFIFVNFLGINSGSISILAFTVEIYIAICWPLISQRFCTIKRTNKIILALWLFALVYCAPWLYLTEVKPDPVLENRQQCEFRVSKEQYFYYFTADLALFYVTPLVVALVIYSKIVKILRKNVVVTFERKTRERVAIGDQESSNLVFSCENAEVTMIAKPEARASLSVETAEARQYPLAINTGDTEERIRARTHVLRMLIVIVVLFAVSWLPYRGLLVYNTFLEKPWLNLWYLFFAKTIIYLNSAMNPFLYSAMSRRFRSALNATLACKEPYEDRTETQNGISGFSLSETNQKRAVITNGNNSGSERPSPDPEAHRNLSHPS